MVGVTCSNIELKDAGWNTFLRNNECNLLKYNSNYRRFESSSRYQSGQFYGVVRFLFAGMNGRANGALFAAGVDTIKFPKP